MTPERRRTTDRAWYIAIVAEPFWFVLSLLVDKRGEGLSLTRFMAIAYTVLVFKAVVNNHPIGANTLWLALASFAVAFGKSTFTFLLTRASLRSQTTQADVTVAETVKKDVTLGYQPTP